MIGYIYYNPESNKLIELTEEFYICDIKYYHFVDHLVMQRIDDKTYTIPTTSSIFGIGSSTLRKKWKRIGKV